MFSEKVILIPRGTGVIVKSQTMTKKRARPVYYHVYYRDVRPLKDTGALFPMGTDASKEAAAAAAATSASLKGGKTTKKSKAPSLEARSGDHRDSSAINDRDLEFSRGA